MIFYFFSQQNYPRLGLVLYYIENRGDFLVTRYLGRISANVCRRPMSTFLHQLLVLTKNVGIENSLEKLGDLPIHHHTTTPPNKDI